MAGLGKINTDYKREGDLKETTTRITTCQPRMTHLHGASLSLIRKQERGH